ncbi:hypothetical protein Tco_0267624 [Tanacetum coccineum]
MLFEEKSSCVVPVSFVQTTTAADTRHSQGLILIVDVNTAALENPYWMTQKVEEAYDLQLIMSGDIQEDLNSRGSFEDASDTGNAPKQQQQVIPQTTAISNIKLPILKKGGEKKFRSGKRYRYCFRVLSPVTAAEIQAVEKERKAKNILLMAIPKEHMRRFHGMDDAKEMGKPSELDLVIFAHKAWSNLAMTMRTNSEIDTFLLMIFLAGFADEVIYSLFAKQTEDLDLLHEDLEQIDDVDIEDKSGNLMEIKKRDSSVINIKESWKAREESMVFKKGQEANEIYEKDKKLKRYRRIGMKAVKEKEQLQKTVDSRKDSSKNLWKLINSGMSSNSKVGLGFEYTINNEGC